MNTETKVENAHGSGAKVSGVGLLLSRAFGWALDEPDLSRGDAVDRILRREGLRSVDALTRLRNEDLLALLSASTDREMERATGKPVSYWQDAVENLP